MFERVKVQKAIEITHLDISGSEELHSITFFLNFMD